MEEKTTVRSVPDGSDKNLVDHYELALLHRLVEQAKSLLASMLCDL